MLRNYTSPTNSSWSPYGIAINGGFLFVADGRLTSSTTVYRIDPTTGALVSQFPALQAAGTRGFTTPSGLAFDDRNNFYVADTRQVWKVNSSNAAILAVYNCSTIQSQLVSYNPRGVAWKSGLLYVSSNAQLLVSSQHHSHRTQSSVRSTLSHACQYAFHSDLFSFYCFWWQVFSDLNPPLPSSPNAAQGRTSQDSGGVSIAAMLSAALVLGVYQ